MVDSMIYLRCCTCSWTAEDGDLRACPQCGGIIDVAYSASSLQPEPSRAGIWRYASRLPGADHAVSLGEGNTPLLPAAHLDPVIGPQTRYYKVEGLNPTGSYKDRIAAVGMARLRALGRTGWAATSSGNAGASMAAYGARACLTGHLFTLERASPAKLAQIRAHGPQIYAVRGLGLTPEAERATWSNLAELCNRRDWGMLVTAYRFSPHAMEGVKTIAFELFEQLGGVPAAVYVPVGGGGLLWGLWRGFLELQAAGLCSTLPRIIAVQPAGCDAIARAWRSGTALTPLDRCASAISGLQLTSPPDGELVLRALHASGGWATRVPDEATYAAQLDLARQEGLFVEPAAAITLAAARIDAQEGRSTGAGAVVCLLTGIGFKDAAAVERMAADRPATLIDPAAILEL